MVDIKSKSQKSPVTDQSCLTRREFLIAGGGASLTFLLLSIPGVDKAIALPAKEKDYPKKKIGILSQLKEEVPIEFQYPFESSTSSCTLVKLGTPAGGGVGPQDDIVAFSNLCTHLGGPLKGTYRKGFRAMGPCPYHLTTYDLTRYGIVISGHATESLPQVLLEVKDDEIYATGMRGLVYGRVDNLK
jgi:arsenite oxidase small subunit